MITRETLLGASLLLVALPVLATAQGLGDAAAQARAKREKTGQTPEPGKVYSNEDLAKGSTSGSSGGSQGAPAASAEHERAADDQPEEPSASDLIAQKAERLKQFEAAVESARAQVAAVEKHMNDLAERLNPLSTTFVYAPGGSLDVNERFRIEAELQEQPSKLEAAKRAVKAAEDALLDFENGRLDAVPGGRPE